VRPNDVSSALRSLYQTRRPVYLWGPPGIGKSSVCRQAADLMGVQFLDIRLPLHDPTDLKFPVVDVKAKSVTWVNSLFPEDKDWQGIVCLEELAQCPPLMQAAAMQLTLDRKIGEYTLPDGASVVACSNRAEDRAGAHKLITPLLNRFIHLDLEVSNDDWQGWAVKNRVSPEVRAFLNWRPGLLHQFDPSSGARAFPTPRSWHFVSDVVSANHGSALPDELLHPVATGCVGEGPAAEFVAFSKTYRELPDVDKILANPAGFKVPTDPSVLYALSGAVVERCRNADAAKLNAVVQVAMRLPDEFAVLTMRDGAVVNEAITKTKDAGKFLLKHKDVLLDGMRS
jgi:hypothetical protein